MAESSILWQTNGTGDGTDTGYTQAQTFDWLRSLLVPNATNLGGVSPDYQNKLAVSGTSSPVSVATGAALVYGIPYVNTGAVTVAIPTPTTATRIDRIVLRANWTAQTVRITRIAGSEGGAAPSLTQSAGTTWDIPLAQVSITTAGVVTVTDQREWLSLVGAGAVTAAKLAAGAVGTAALADDGVTQPKIGPGAVGTTELADDGVTQPKIGPGAVGATELATDAVETAKIKAGAVTNAKLSLDSVTDYNIAALSVGASELKDGGVWEQKIATGAVTETKLGAGAVTTAKLADDAVDSQKVGSGVPALVYRQGGSATNWQLYGTTSYTPGAVRIQCGVRRIANPLNTFNNDFTVTFPVPFSNNPVVFVTPALPDGSTDNVDGLTIRAVANNSFAIDFRVGFGTAEWCDLNWVAIGPE